jgi:myosin-5
MSHPYIKGTRVWLPDATTGWKPAEITFIEQTPSDGANEESLTLHIEDDAGESSTLTFPLSSVIAAAQDQQLDSRNPPSPEATADSFKDAQTKGLPPLRNPPNMEAEEDLSNLSNLNEPSGESAGASRPNQSSQKV